MLQQRQNNTTTILEQYYNQAETELQHNDTNYSTISKLTQ